MAVHLDGILIFLLVFGGFRCGRCKFQLYLAVKGGKLGLQLFQLVFLLPYLARYRLELRNFLFQHLVFLFILVDDARYLLQSVQEVRGGGVRVSHRQMPVVVVVPVIARHHETVVGELQSVP